GPEVVGRPPIGVQVGDLTGVGGGGPDGLGGGGAGHTGCSLLNWRACATPLTALSCVPWACLPSSATWSCSAPTMRSGGCSPSPCRSRPSACSGRPNQTVIRPGRGNSFPTGSAAYVPWRNTGTVGTRK